MGCVGVLLMTGVPTGLELPEVEVPGRGRLLPVTGDTVGGVTDDMTIVGGFIEWSVGSSVRVVDVFVISVVDVFVVSVVVVFAVSVLDVFVSVLRVAELC